jgi:hypothetical protein
MYGMTAAACVEGAVRMTEPSFDKAGALAPSEAFEVESFLQALGAYLTHNVVGSSVGR